MTQDRFDHVFVQPSSFDDSLAFYRDALGCTVTFHGTTPLLGSG